MFAVLSDPYLGRQTRAMAAKIEVLERGSDLVLAAHRTPLRAGLVATTVETVRFTRPSRVDFRLVRGPVPHLVESFLLEAEGAKTRLRYEGEMETDLGALGLAWGGLVGRQWERAVRASMMQVKAEAERRSATGSRGIQPGGHAPAG